MQRRNEEGAVALTVNPLTAMAPAVVWTLTAAVVVDLNLTEAVVVVVVQ